jgi:hypothetical protein
MGGIAPAGIIPGPTAVPKPGRIPRWYCVSIATSEPRFPEPTMTPGGIFRIAPSVTIGWPNICIALGGDTYNSCHKR